MSIELTATTKKVIRNRFTRLSSELGDAAAVAYIAGQMLSGEFSDAQHFRELTTREQISLIQSIVGMAITANRKRLALDIAKGQNTGTVKCKSQILKALEFIIALNAASSQSLAKSSAQTTRTGRRKTGSL